MINYQGDMNGRKKNSSQRGYVLLGLMLTVTLILIALAMEAPRLAQQIKRDKKKNWSIAAKTMPPRLSVLSTRVAANTHFRLTSWKTPITSASCARNTKIP